MEEDYRHTDLTKIVPHHRSLEEHMNWFSQKIAIAKLADMGSILYLYPRLQSRNIRSSDVSEFARRCVGAAQELEERIRRTSDMEERKKLLKRQSALYIFADIDLENCSTAP